MLDFILLGIVQGLTEFLPVSSSGHVFLLEYFLGMEPSLALEIYLHGASLLAVLVFFRGKIWELIRAVSDSVFRGVGYSPQTDLATKLIVATVLTAPVGLYLSKIIDHGDLSLETVSVTLGITAVLVLVSDWASRKTKNSAPAARSLGEVGEFSWMIAGFLGLVQGLAVFPGISRSGLTIAFLLLCGLPRKFSAEISFLLSIPTIGGAFILTVAESGLPFGSADLWVGFGAAVIASWWAIGWMLRIVERHWVWFAPYCAGLAGIVWYFS